MSKKQELIKQTAIKMVKEAGLINLSRKELCERANIPDGSFSRDMGCSFTEFIDQIKPEISDVKNHAVNKKRVNPSLRKDHILRHAVEESMHSGYHAVLRSSIANRAGVSMGLVTNYFGTMTQLRRAVMRYAVENEVLIVIAQGLANKDKQAKKASTELKEKAAAYIINS